MNTMKILVTFANTYDVDGVRGMTLNYFFWGENGEAMQSQIRPVKEAAGVQRAKCSMPFDTRQKITFVPGVYEARMGFKVRSDGKPVMTIEDISECLARVVMYEEPMEKMGK